MPNEFLDLNYGQLRREVGRFLGFDRDPANWGSNEITDVQDVIDAGLRQFYRPPRLAGERMAYQWKFLRPYGTVQIQAGMEDFDLPEDFAGIDGVIYFVEDDRLAAAIRIVNHSTLLYRRAQYWYTSGVHEPKMAAIAPKPTSGTQQQGYQLMIWPIPDADYTLRFRYFARQRPLRNDFDVPMGAEEHAETIRASCIAAAENHLDDERGIKYQQFMERVMASMDIDRRFGAPRDLGKNLDWDPNLYASSGELRSLGGLVTLEAFPDDGDTPLVNQLVTQEGNLVQTQDGEAVVIQ